MLCIGDSLTAGTKNSKDSYPAQLEMRLLQRGHRLYARNYGAWGEDCDAILRRLPQAVAEAARYGPCAFVLILAGTNDILAYAQPQVLLSKLKRLHESAAATADAPCVGVFTIPRCARFSAQQEATRQEVNAGLAEMCQQAAKNSRMLVDLDVVGQELAPDGVHYSGAGYIAFAEKAQEAMRRLFESS
jgi:lysophospholipase L1-like esterase